MKKARRFDINKLPADVLNKVDGIMWNEEYNDRIDDGDQPEDVVLGWVELEPQYCFDFDGSHSEGFLNRDDLIRLVRTSTMDYNAAEWGYKD